MRTDATVQNQRRGERRVRPLGQVRLTAFIAGLVRVDDGRNLHLPRRAQARAQPHARRRAPRPRGLDAARPANDGGLRRGGFAERREGLSKQPGVGSKVLRVRGGWGRDLASKLEPDRDVRRLDHQILELTQREDAARRVLLVVPVEGLAADAAEPSTRGGKHRRQRKRSRVAAFLPPRHPRADILALFARHHPPARVYLPVYLAVLRRLAHQLPHGLRAGQDGPLEPANLRGRLFAALVVIGAHPSVPDYGVQGLLELGAHRPDVLPLFGDLRVGSPRRFVFRQVHDPPAARDVQHRAAELCKRVPDGVPEIEPRRVDTSEHVQKIRGREHAPRRDVTHRERVSELGVLPHPRDRAVRRRAGEAAGQVRNHVPKRRDARDERAVSHRGRRRREVSDEAPAHDHEDVRLDQPG
mmetsp:Transcript_8606/g.37947  ORF Transcript_8606/g.37947 Transcript_8606/m.37947 type:complete len:413 (+) Transcript_8606:1607-2845(+)